MPDEPTATDVIDAHRAWLEDRVRTLERGARSARDGMRVDGDHRPSSRGERGAVSERGAMRAGLLMRVAACKEALGELDAIPAASGARRIRAGAVFLVDDGERERWMAILPGGQGDELDVSGVPVQVVSLKAPVARALLGLEEGDVAELTLPSGEVEIEVLEVG